ncbi:MAG: c-type cytochrome [Opitutae bacterium]|nr:c-type cytochrome [Opitutae bacterium]
MAEIPGWAFTVNPPAGHPTPDDGRAIHVPDSAITFTRTQITNLAGPVPDWHPDEHPAMPPIVAKGRAPQVIACAYCHLPNGAGRPENASLAGLPAGYIKQQMQAFRHGDRPGSEPKRLPQTLMIALAKDLTESEIDAAAAYFAALKPTSFVQVIETATVPKTMVAGWVLTLAPGAGTEPIGNRIIEIPEDFTRFENRDSRTPYLAYVPVGSIQRGAELVTAIRAGTAQSCISCHGPDLKGLGDIPRLAGRSPSFLMRQLVDLRNGVRTGATSELMKPVIANLTDADLVSIVAYLASREP